MARPWHWSQILHIAHSSIVSIILQKCKTMQILWSASYCRAGVPRCDNACRQFCCAAWMHRSSWRYRQVYPLFLQIATTHFSRCFCRWQQSVLGITSHKKAMGVPRFLSLLFLPIGSHSFVTILAKRISKCLESAHMFYMCRYLTFQWEVQGNWTHLYGTMILQGRDRGSVMEVVNMRSSGHFERGHSLMVWTSNDLSQRKFHTGQQPLVRAGLKQLISVTPYREGGWGA